MFCASSPETPLPLFFWNIREGLFFSYFFLTLLKISIKNKKENNLIFFLKSEIRCGGGRVSVRQEKHGIVPKMVDKLRYSHNDYKQNNFFRGNWNNWLKSLDTDSLNRPIKILYFTCYFSTVSLHVQEIFFVCCPEKEQSNDSKIY